MYPLIPVHESFHFKLHLLFCYLIYPVLLDVTGALSHPSLLFLFFFIVFSHLAISLMTHLNTIAYGVTVKLDRIKVDIIKR